MCGAVLLLGLGLVMIDSIRDIADDLFTHTAALNFEDHTSLSTLYQLEGYLGYGEKAYNAFTQRGHRHLPQTREVLSGAAQALGVLRFDRCIACAGCCDLYFWCPVYLLVVALGAMCV